MINEDQLKGLDRESLLQAHALVLTQLQDAWKVADGAFITRESNLAYDTMITIKALEAVVSQISAAIQSKS